MIEPPETKEEYAQRNIKRDLMREFGALWFKTTEPSNFSSMRQIDNETICVSLQQYPDQGETHDISIYDEFTRIRHFGWQLRYIKYDKDSTLHMYFEKVDWRSVQSYGLMPTKHNNEKDLWWLNADAKPEELGI